MKSEQISQFFLILALIGTLFGGFSSWRYYRIPVELRLPQYESLWQALPYGLLLLIIAIIIVKKRTHGD